MIDKYKVKVETSVELLSKFHSALEIKSNF